MLLTVVVKVIINVVDCCCVAELQPGGEAAEQGLHQLQPQPGFRQRVTAFILIVYIYSIVTVYNRNIHTLHFRADMLCCIIL